MNCLDLVLSPLKPQNGKPASIEEQFAWACYVDNQTIKGLTFIDFNDWRKRDEK